MGNGIGHRRPNHKTKVIPEVGGHKDPGDFQGKEGQFQQQPADEEGQTNGGTKGGQRAGLPAQVDDGQVNAGGLDHLLDQLGYGRGKGTDQPAKAGQPDPGGQGAFQGDF